MIRVLAFVIALSLPSLALANAGLPMLALAWPLHWIALLPVTLLEGELAHRRLEVQRLRGMKVSLVGNLISTLIGVPLAWAAMLAVEAIVGYGVFSFVDDPSISRTMHYVLFPFMVAWLGPTNNVWIVYLAFVILAVPFCIASIFIEGKVAKRMLPSVPAASVKAWVKLANVVSYVLLVVFSALFPLVHVFKAP